MITSGGQWGSVRPAGQRKKKPGQDYLDIMRQQHGQITQDVTYRKEKEQSDKETAWQHEQTQKQHDLAVQQWEDQREQAKTQDRLGKANTGLNLINTVMKFFHW